MPWLDGAQIERSLEQIFNNILTTRMVGMPLINPALSVRALGFGRVNEDWLGVLITPWFMNLLLLPGLNSSWLGLSPGNKFEQSFPYGNFEFTVAHEGQVGSYAQCSLFSPMFQFEDQTAVMTVALSALQNLLTPPPRETSRRNILRGHFGNR